MGGRRHRVGSLDASLDGRGRPGWQERDGWELLVHTLSLVLDGVVSGKLKGVCVGRGFGA